MAHRITILAHAPFVHLIVHGDNSPAAVRGYLAEAASFCRRASTQALLIEEHLVGESLQPTELFSIAQESLGALPPSLRHVAFVDTNPDHDPSLMRFAETIAVNRGVNVRVFPTVAAAAEWLSTPSPELGPSPADV